MTNTQTTTRRMTEPEIGALLIALGVDPDEAPRAWGTANSGPMWGSAAHVCGDRDEQGHCLGCGWTS